MKAKILLSIMIGLFATNAQAQEAQEKANVIPMVAIPEELGTAHDYQEELVEAWVRVNVVYTGVLGFDIYRPGAFFGGMYFEFRDLRTGLMKVKVFLNDTFTAQFADRSTVEFKFLGIYAPSGLMFQVVPGSERDASGEPIAVNVRPRERFDISSYIAWESTWISLYAWGNNWGVVHYARNQR